MKSRIFLVALLLGFSASAQTPLPARQVSVDTNMANIAVSLPFTVQEALRWIDSNWPAIDSSSWTILAPATDTLQSAFTWIDENWEPGLAVSNWSFLAPSNATAQSTFDFLDDWFVSAGASNMFLLGTNIVGAAFSNGQWSVEFPNDGWVSNSLAVSGVYPLAPLAFDLENLHSYLLGGPHYTNYLVTANIDGATTNYTVTRDPAALIAYGGSPTSAPPLALVPALQRDQATTSGNFALVNSNTWYTTNLFYMIGQLLEIPTNQFASAGVSYRVAYNRWLTNFHRMSTNYAAFPTNLFSGFPGLFSLYTDTTVNPAVGDLRADIYAVLRELGLGSYSPFTYVANTYTSNFQTYVVPTNVEAGSLIEVHCWGGGGGGVAGSADLGAYGGYARATLVVTQPTNGILTNAAYVYPGMPLYVQVGPASGRAAVWRATNAPPCHTITNELIVAGGAGGGIGGEYGGYGGGLVGGAAANGAQPGTTTGAAGGAGTIYGAAGVRIWGGLSDGAYYDYKGGDGYYGGGSGGTSHSQRGGGGGSGYVHPSLLTNATYQIQSGSGGVKGTGDAGLYGSGDAGGIGNAGRVVFKRIL